MSERSLLMIPGPIEFEPAVLRTMAIKTPSHVSAEFVEVFGETLARLRDVFLTAEGQPFVVPGSGTLAMDMAAVNFIEPSDHVLLVNTGYFSDRFAAICERYGAQVDHVRTEVGDAPSADEIGVALKKKRYKLLVATHVDTSTGVAVDVEAIGRLAQENGALSVIDGVCALAGMAFRQDEWAIDVCLTASQKALGVPPGLAVLMVSRRAIDVLRGRRSAVASFYADLGNWLPVMEGYEARRPHYFGTPAVNLIYALHESVRQILAEGMEARFRRHRILSRAFQAAMGGLGLRLVPVSPARMSHTMSAVYYPDGVDSALLGKIRAAGVTVAGGIHPRIADRYFRVGHMGAVTPGDILTTVGAIEQALLASGHEFEPGVGLAAAQKGVGQL